MQADELVSVVAANVKRYRKIIGMTQTDLANAIGSCQEHISDIERGKIKIGVDTLAKIGEAVGVEPHLLVIREQLQKIG